MNPALFKRSLLALAISTASLAHAADPLYVTDPAGDDIRQFEGVLSLTTTAPWSDITIDNDDIMGLSVAERRDLIDFITDDPISNPLDGATNIVTSGVGKLDSYIYEYLTSDYSVSSDITLGTGTTDSDPNLPLILDLGESLFKTTGSLQTQNAIFVSTVNSYVSSGGLEMSGEDKDSSDTAFNAGYLDVDPSATGRIEVGEIFDLGSSDSKLSAQFKVVLDLNSTLQNGASFVFLEETGTQDSNAPLFDFTSADSINSILFDTSYVINTSATTSYTDVTSDGETIDDPQKVIITFQRDDNEYITKSYTDNHPSNDAALKLGTIAAAGVALGDMQTALTRLDINDFGYGDTAENLAVQVKRLAPIANNSFVISTLDATQLASGAIDYRINARRGNWSGNSELDNSFWIRAVGSTTNSSGSVPVATLTAQDTAGHDGYKATSGGVAFGLDKTFKNGLIGASYAGVKTDIMQLDDRVGEDSNQYQHITSLYGELSDRNDFLSATFISSTATIQGWRKTAIDRIADYSIPVRTNELKLKAGHRFDLSDGRSAITPYLMASKSRYTQSHYEETGAGALSLEVEKLEADKTTAELGLNMSHKGRFAGIKALTVLNAAVGKDLDVSDLTVHANYTGATDDVHSDYTSFTTPAETWANNYVTLGLDLQLEAAKGVMVKMGVDGEMRQSRQSYAGELSVVWAF